MDSERTMLDWVRPRLRTAAAYSANKSQELLQLQLTDVIKLNANENPYGCSPRVKKALADYDEYHVYPDATQTELKKLLAEYAGTTPERIVASAGAEQIVDLIIRLFVDPGDEVITCGPTYQMFSTSTNMCSGDLIDIPRDKDFAVDIEAIKSSITGKTKMICMCNPNNPTGNVTPRDELFELVKTGVPVLVDEAYYEFSGETMVPFVEQYPNLIIVRTSSKWAGMAGLRFGYCICAPEVAACLMRIKAPFNVNAPAALAFKESLKDRDYLMSKIDTMKSEAARLARELEELGFLKAYPTAANFIFFEALKGDPARMVKDLEDQGIMIRYYNHPALQNGLRISIGLPEQHDRVIRAFKEIGERLN